MLMLRRVSTQPQGHSCFHSLRGFNFSMDGRKQYSNVSVDENIFRNVSGVVITEAFENALVWTMRSNYDDGKESVRAN